VDKRESNNCFTAINQAVMRSTKTSGPLDIHFDILFKTNTFEGRSFQIRLYQFDDLPEGVGSCDRFDE